MVTGSLAYDDTRQFVNSISRISGFQASVAAGVTSPVLGSDYDYVWGEVAWNGYLRVPGTKQWVLALHLAAGLSQGTFGGQYPFSLGGVPPPDVAGLLLSALGLRQRRLPARSAARLSLGHLPGQPPRLRDLRAALPHRRAAVGLLDLAVLRPADLRRALPRRRKRLGPAGGRALVGAHPVRHRSRARRGAGPGLLPAGRRCAWASARGSGGCSPRAGPPDPYAETQVYVTLGESF